MSWLTDDSSTALIDEMKKIISSQKRRICVGCGVNFSRPKEASKGSRYCSEDCKTKNPRSGRKCKPHCPADLLSTRTVVFKDGSTHIQRCCSKCRRTRYIPKNPNSDKNKSKVQKLATALKIKYGSSFYTEEPWLRVRFQIIKRDGRKCAACGAIGKDNQFHVDHIKPRSKYPHLEYDLENLQVLCRDCNIGKKNTDETDFRTS